jgi:hypothetical protein
MLLDVMGHAVMFGPVVSQVHFSRTPEETSFAALKPVKSHGHSFFSSRLNVAGDNSKSCAVVCLH